MKKLCSLLLAFCMLLAMLPGALAAPAANDLEGSCGDGVSYRLLGSSPSYTLEIYGEGAMDDYAGFYKTPWYPQYGKIARVAVLEGVTHVGSNAFSGQKKLGDALLASTVKTLGAGCFARCEELVSVTLPDGLQGIGERAFIECDKLASIKLPDSVETIGDRAFEGCRQLTALRLPLSLREIGSYAFTACGHIMRLVFPESLRSIGDWAFSGFDDGVNELKSILFLGDAPAIGYGAFQNAKAAVTYYANKKGWTEEVRQDYQGELTWVAQYLPPAAPKLTASLNAKGKPVLKWKAVDGAEKYQIYRSAAGKDDSFKLLKTVTGTSFTNSSAAVDKTYSYKVRAVAPDGTKGGYSAVVKKTVKPAAPAVKISYSAKGKPVLTWKAVEGAVKYQIYRSTTGEDGSFKLLKTVTGLKYTNSSAAGGKTFYYKVRAVTEAGTKSAFSAVVRKTVKPAAPSVTSSFSAKDKPVLTWKAVTGAEKYQIYRSTTGKDGSFKLLKTVTGLKYTNSKAAAGKTYYYKVRAVAADGTKGIFSAVVKKTAK